MDALVRLAESWWPLYAIHMLETSLFILLVWAVDRFVRLDTRLQYALWLCALVKVFVPPFYTLSLPQVAGSVPESLATTPILQPVLSPPATINPETFFNHTGQLSWVFWVFLTWICSALAILVLILVRNCVFQKSLARAKHVRLPESVVDLKGATTLRFFVLDNLASPLMVGIFRPRLYLPESWHTWPASQLRGVVAHELAHYHSRDLWALAFQVLATVFFGLNPLIWLVNRRLTFLRELRCDEDALKQSGMSAVAYGKLLYAFLDHKRYTGLSLLGFNINGAQMKKRFEHVLNFHPKPRVWWQFVIPVLIGVLILPFSVRKTYSEMLPVLTEHSLIVEHVEIWPGLQKIDVRVKTVSQRSLVLLRKQKPEVRQTVEHLFGEIQKSNTSIEDIHRLSDIFKDQINLVLGRQWVTAVVFETHKQEGGE